MPGFPPEQKAALRHNDQIEKGWLEEQYHGHSNHTKLSLVRLSFSVPTFWDGRFSYVYQATVSDRGDTIPSKVVQLNLFNGVETSTGCL